AWAHSTLLPAGHGARPHRLDQSPPPTAELGTGPAAPRSGPEGGRKGTSYGLSIKSFEKVVFISM
uniref:Uncharacterized protein n=1 Tax=Takifugu rubripes TaxID=31033 RepID=A0A674NFM6_TAKRU